MNPLTLAAILSLAGKTTNSEFTPEEIVLLQSKIKHLIVKRTSGRDGLIHTSIVAIHDICVSYGKDTHSEKSDEQQRIQAIGFNIIDTETRKDDEKIYRIRNKARFLYHFTVSKDGEVTRSSSDYMEDSNVTKASYFIM